MKIWVDEDRRRTVSRGERDSVSRARWIDENEWRRSERSLAGRVYLAVANLAGSSGLDDGVANDLDLIPRHHYGELDLIDQIVRSVFLSHEPLLRGSSLASDALDSCLREPPNAHV